MSDIKIFDNPEFGRVRVIYELVENGTEETWFVGSDVAMALGYANPSKAVREHVDDEDKGVNEIVTPGGTQRVVTINESGVYSLVFSSKLESAKRFKRWVTSEVLPSVRKNGGYITNQESMSDEDLMARAYVVAQRVLADRERRLALANETIAIQNQQILEMQPKVSYYDIVLQCQDLVSIRQIAKDFGMSAQDMNKRLCDLGIQFKQNKTYLLYQPYAQQGYAQSRTYAYYDNYGRKHGNMHTEWTQKGRLFIYDLMKKQGILPVCERNNTWQ